MDKTTPTASFQVVCLPKELIDSIKKLNLTRPSFNKSLLFADLVLSTNLIYHKDPNKYIWLGSKYLRKVFNSKYRDWLRVLLDNHIIECDNEWYKFLGKSLGYRINSQIVSDWDEVEVLKIQSKSGYKPSPKDAIYLDGLSKFHGSLSINFDRHYEITSNLVQGDEKDTRFKRFYWLRAIKLLENDILIAKRSSSNSRLNTNYTNLPNPLFEEIKKDNKLVEIDAVNSQFAILANLIKDFVNDDFVKDAIGGTLYEKVAKKLGVNRKEAKEKMFKTIYSKPHYISKDKSSIGELYPETIPFLDKYKQKKSHSDLAIAMQKKESEIYLDGVLKKLYSMGILAITKHDSIIVYQEQAQLIKSVIIEVLDAMAYELKIKIV